MARPPRVIEELLLDLIIADDEINPREAIDPYTVAAYSEDMTGGASFPPVIVFRDEKPRYWLADGYHRHAAAVDAGLSTFPCDIREGTREDAMWYAAGANKTHGLRRTNADKRRAVQKALQHPNGAEKSDSVIAKHCGVSHTMVAKYREELESTCKVCKSTERVGADGRKIDTANIGKPKNDDPGAVDEGISKQFSDVLDKFIDTVDRKEYERVLGQLPEDQREDAKLDYLEHCDEQKAEPTLEGLAEHVSMWAADNEPVGDGTAVEVEDEQSATDEEQPERIR